MQEQDVQSLFQIHQLQIYQILDKQALNPTDSENKKITRKKINPKSQNNQTKKMEKEKVKIDDKKQQVFRHVFFIFFPQMFDRFFGSKIADF